MTPGGIRAISVTYLVLTEYETLGCNQPITFGINPSIVKPCFAPRRHVQYATRADSVWIESRVIATFSEIRASRSLSNDVGMRTCRDKPANASRISVYCRINIEFSPASRSSNSLLQSPYGPHLAFLFSSGISSKLPSVLISQMQVSTHILHQR